MGDQGRTVWAGGASLLVAGTLAVGLSACGGDSGGGGGGPTTPTPTPTPCTQEVLVQDNGGVPSSTVVADDFSFPRNGRLDVTLDWTNAESPVGFYLVPANTCSTIEEFNARTCEFVIQEEPPQEKPLRFSRSGFPAGNYRWLVANFGEGDESVALEIVLSEGSCAPLTGGDPSVSARGPAAALPARELLRR